MQPARLLCPWDFPGKNTGVGCHFLLQGNFPNLPLLHWRWILFHLSHQGSPFITTQKEEKENQQAQLPLMSTIQGLKVKVTPSCPTLCNPVDYIVHGILQAKILEWVAFPFSRGSSQPRDQSQVSHTAGGFFTSWATREFIIQGLNHDNYSFKYVRQANRSTTEINVLHFTFLSFQ